MKKISPLLTVALLSLSPIINTQAANNEEYSYVGNWDKVTSFSFNENANHLVFTMTDAQGRELAYESFKTSSGWTAEEEIEAINSSATGVSIGGLHLTSDEQRIYFHANYPNGMGGYDLYFTDKTDKGWSEPTLIEELSTDGNEMFPTTAAGNALIYFLRPLPVNDLQNSRSDNTRMCTMSASVNQKGKWGKANKASAVLNTGYVQDVRLATDGVTLLFSSKTDKKEQSLVWYASRVGDDVWEEVNIIFSERDHFDVVSPQIVDGELYAIVCQSKKKTHEGSIVKINVDKDDILTQKTISETLTIVDKATQKPVAATVTVRHSISGKIVGLYSSSASDGKAQITAARNTPYEVTIAAEGYAPVSYQIEANANVQAKQRTVQLINTATLVVAPFETTTYGAVEASVVAVRTSDRSVIRPQASKGKQYTFSLPIGDKYNVIASAKDCDKNEYLLDLTGDIVESEFYVDLGLAPKTKEVIVSVIDASSKSGILAKVVLTNGSEVIEAEATNGFAKVAIRENATYDMAVTAYGYIGAKAEVNDNATVALNHAHAGASFTAKGFVFAQKTDLPTDETLANAEPIVEMLQANKYLKVKMQVYASDAQSTGERQRLSAARATALAQYIQNQGIEEKRLVVVPNSSECLSLNYGEVKFDILAND